MPTDKFQVITKGFLKRAAQRGYNEKEATLLFKKANASPVGPVGAFLHEGWNGLKSTAHNAWTKAQAARAAAVQAASQGAGAVAHGAQYAGQQAQASAAKAGQGIATGANAAYTGSGLKSVVDEGKRIHQSTGGDIGMTAVRGANAVTDKVNKGVKDIKGITNAAQAVGNATAPAFREVQEMANPLVQKIKGLLGQGAEAGAAVPPIHPNDNFLSGLKDSVGMGEQGLSGMYKAPLSFMEDGGAGKNIGRVAPLAGLGGLAALNMSGGQEQDPRYR